MPRPFVMFLLAMYSLIALLIIGTVAGLSADELIAVLVSDATVFLMYTATWFMFGSPPAEPLTETALSQYAVRG